MSEPLILAVETSSRLGSVALAVGPKLLAQISFAGPTRHSAELFPSICNLLERFGRKPDQIEQVYISVGPGSFTGLRIAVTLAKMLHFANGAKVVAVDSLDVTAANILRLIAPQASSIEHQASNIEYQVSSIEYRESSIENQVSNIEKVAVVVDAKRNQFFIAVYENRTFIIEPLLTTHQSPLTSNEHQASTPDPRPLLPDPRPPTPDPLLKILPDSLMTAEEFLQKFTDSDRPIHLLGDGLLYHKGKFTATGVQFFDEKYWSPSAENVHLLGLRLAIDGHFSDPLTLTPNYLLRPDFKLKPR